MSNKQQLQQNNTKYASLIETLRGKAVGGSGGDTSIEDSLVARTITTYTNNRLTKIGAYAFYDCRSLTSVDFPVCTHINNSSAFCYCTRLTTISFPNCSIIGEGAFQQCVNLTIASFPVCTFIGNYAFAYCNKLTSISFPICPTIESYAFCYCLSLTSVSFPKVTSIGNYAFRQCSKLSSIYLGNALTVCTLSDSNAFQDTGITRTAGSIFVRPSLVSAYKSATNWAYFADRIFAMNDEDIPEEAPDNIIIDFYVGTTRYEAQYGMTWAEWCASEYNTNNYYILNGLVYQNSFTTIDGVTSDDLIEANKTYSIGVPVAPPPILP